MVDTGDLYASKDFYDPVNKRRINWGWARVPPSSTQTLPREVTWHPELQQLVFSPLVEQAALRASPALFSKENFAVSGTEKFGLPAGAGLQSEIVASFPVPKTATSFGVGLFGTQEVFVDFVPAEATASIHGVSSSWKVNVGVRGATTTTNSSSAFGAQGAAKKPKPQGGGDTLNLLPSDSTIEVRVFYDQTFAEIYFMNGRVALTKTLAGVATGDHSVFSSAPLTANVSAYGVNSIWVSPEEVIATPRL